MLDFFSMKAKAKSKASSAVKKASPKGKPARTRRGAQGRWRMSDLPPELAAELRDRLDEAKRGENLVPFDQGMREAEAMADEIVGILNRYDSRRSDE